MGFSLVEMIGVLTVLSILAMALAPILIKQMDRIAGEKENSQLKAFSEAFRQGVLTTKSIPSEFGWDQMIATNLGLQTNQVRINERRVARVFLIDYNLRINGAALPYGPQAVTGSSVKPVSPRLMILSSLSQPLPVASGVTASAAAFANIWDATEGTIPTGWTWSGKSDDLKVQRIHFADLFIELALNSDGTTAPYAIDGVATNTSSISTNYFVDGSLIELYNCDDLIRPKYSEILHRSKSFAFSSCSWQQGGDFTSRAIRRPTPLDLQLAANAFLAAAQNPFAAGYPSSSSPDATRLDVYRSITNYMGQYISWAPMARANLLQQAGNGPMKDAQTDLAASTLALRDYNSP